MKLFAYEIRKLLFQRTGCVLIAAVWLLGQFLFHQSSMIQTRLSRSTLSEEIQYYEDGIRGLGPEEALAWLEEEAAGLEQEQMEAASSGDYMSTAGRSTVLKEYLEQYRYAAEYPAYLEKVLSQAEAMEQMAVFQKQGSFAIANIKKTQRDFQKLQESLSQNAPTVDAPQFLSAATSYGAGNALLLLQLVILTMCIFGYEQEGDRKQLLTMQYRGRYAVSAAKLMLLAVGSAVLVLFLYGGFLLQAYAAYGGGAMNAPVQSLQEFRQCSRELSCFGYLLLFLFCKVLSVILFALMAAVAVSWVKSSAGMLLFGAGIAVCYLLYSRLPQSGTALWFKEVNPAAWMNTWEWMHGYLNVGLFGYAIGFDTCFYAGTGMGIVCFGVLAAVMFPMRAAHRIPRFVQRLAAAGRRFLSHFAETASIVWQQLYQMFAYKKRFVLLAAAGIAIYLAGVRPDQGYYYLEKATYNSYMGRVGGLYTEDTEEFLEQERAHLSGEDGYARELSDKLEAGELTEDEYRYEAAMYQMELDQKKDGFERLSKQWELVKSAAKEQAENAEAGNAEAGNAGFFHQFFAEELFLDEERDFLLSGLCLLVILVFLAPFCRADAPCDRIFQTAWRGRGNRMAVRSVINAVTAVGIGVGIYVSGYHAVFAAYAKQDFSIAAACLPEFTSLDSSITMGTLLGISVVSKLLGVILTAVLITAISQMPLESTAYYLVLAVLFGGPMLLSMTGIPAEWFSLLGLLQAERLAMAGVGRYLLYAAACIIIVSGLYMLSFRKRLNTGMRKRGK